MTLLIFKSPVLELKPLPTRLKYEYLDDNDTLPVVIATSLLTEKEKALLDVLKAHKKLLGGSLLILKELIQFYVSIK